MFWGLNLKPNRKYTQTSPKTFHISSAALDSLTALQGTTNQIFIRSDNQKYLICTLKKDVCEQVNLDLNFSSGETICFESIGDGKVTLSGYLVTNMGFDDSDDDEEFDTVNTTTDNKKAKAMKTTDGEEIDDDVEEEEEEDFDIEAELEDEDDSDEEVGDLDEMMEDDEEEDEDEIEEEPQSKAKKPKLDKPHKQQNGVANEVESSAEKASKKSKKDKKQKQQDKKQQQQQQKPEPQQKAGGERTLTGGVKVEDIRVGNGPEVKTGKRAQVFYEGRLKANNKVFDSCRQGSGLKFRVGGGEVIKGWDVGVAGMKVGGKRRITCPPHMAYGARGMPPTIPPNSTLVFEVELKGVN